MKLSVNLVTWNGAKYVPLLFESLRKQTFKDWTLFVLDNNSGDNTVELIKKELSNFGVQYKIIENKENKGFAGGHNQAFKETDAQYVLLLNQDMYLAPDCLEKGVMFLDNHPDAAAVSPRLMKWDFPNNFTEQIDALGLKVYRSRRAVEQYTGQNWLELKSKFSSPILPVFGVSGALPVFRTAALKNICYADGGIFDEAYHSYKEDLDLAYRLAVAGYKSYVLLDAVAYHDRSAAGPKELGDAKALANKKNQSEWVRYNSYRNHIMTLYKNEYWQNFTLDFPWILWYELKKSAYFLLFDRRVLGGLKGLFTKDLAQKRQYIRSLRKVAWHQMRKWWA